MVLPPYVRPGFVEIEDQIKSKNWNSGFFCQHAEGSCHNARPHVADTILLPETKNTLLDLSETPINRKVQ